MVEDVQHDALERLPEFDAYAVPVADIVYDETFNCRGPFTLESVEDLAGSIKDNGLQFPVVVQPWDGDRFRLLAGHRRFIAVTRWLHWEKIPAGIRHGLTERQARLLNFTENLERKDLNPLEEAQALGRLYPAGVSLNVASLELKRPTRWVHDRLRLLKLAPEVQQLAAARLISMVQVAVLIALPVEEQIIAARQIATTRQEHGRGCSLQHIDRKYRRKFHYRKSKMEINKMVKKMLGRGITGLGPRMGAWCAGYLDDAELLNDIQEWQP